ACIGPIRCKGGSPVKKMGPFVITFLVAFLLAKILASIFNFAGFSLDDPQLLLLGLDLLFWAASWAVSFIVYATVRDAIRTKRQRKQARQKAEEGEFEPMP
ncbi:MAG: hypothetical protein GX879_12055, partial [Bacteroidales bacterium]|nr:hypothetical protein [Bacteroidales bacterium]